MKVTMEFLAELRRRIAMLLHPRRFHDDLEDEMRLHRELRQQQLAERGLSADAAHFAAQRRFGNATLLKERSQQAWGWTWLESLGQDTVYGIRGLLRSPGVSAVALLSLALGIGANTAIFTLIDTVMLRSLPVKDPGQLYIIGDAGDNGITSDFARTDLYAYPIYRRFQRENQVFSSVAAIFSMLNSIQGFIDGRTVPEPLNAQLVTGTYFDTLGVEPFLGRMLSDSDDNSEGDHPVVVASYRWWKTRMAADPTAAGKTIRMGDRVYTIVGIAPPEFFGSKVGEAPDLWVPMSMAGALPPHWGGYKDNHAASLYPFARLKPGVTVEQATSNADLIFHQIFAELQPTFLDYNPARTNATILRERHVQLTPLAKGISELRGQFSEPLRILMALVALVLLVACANIANLLLARSTARAREFAVRQALGAARGRLVRQLFTESLVLAVAGGALGLIFATTGSRLLLHMVSNGGPELPVDVGLHTPLLLFTFAVTVVTALLFGTIPAFRATRLELTQSLKDGRSASNSAAKSPLARALVIMQVAFSLVLLAGAGAFLRSFLNLTRVDTGFDNPSSVLLFKTDESSIEYKPDDTRPTLLRRQIEERIAALPGVASCSFSSFTYHEGSWNDSIFVQGFDNDKGINVKHDIVGKDYLRTMGIPLLAGRNFGPQDTPSTPSAPQAAIISQRMAKVLFPAGSPIGRHYGDLPQKSGEYEVIGVARDVQFGSLDEAPQFVDYHSYTQRNEAPDDFEVRFTGNRDTIAAEVRQTIRAIDPNIAIVSVQTLDERIGSTAVRQRLVAQLSIFFGLVAVFLSSIGIYGLMSYVVSRRTSEIGIRMALGAARSHVSWLVMREIAVLVAAGVAIGIPATLAGGRLVASMLYDLKPSDPFSLGAAVVLLVSVAVLAGSLPARRASRVDPMTALRCE
jgi:predicted permease